MSNTPIIYKTTHRVKFSDLDPYNHMRTAAYSAYYVDHRMEGRGPLYLFIHCLLSLSAALVCVQLGPCQF